MKALADNLVCTTDEVLKGLHALQAAGIPVEADPHSGYRLAQPVDVLDAASILTQLPAAHRTNIASLEAVWSLDSTQSELMRRPAALTGIEILFAERQTAGRGRRGRIWISPLASQLSFSLARCFSGELVRLGGLSLVTGIAVVEALHALGVSSVGLKWPNDLLALKHSKLHKLGGVLVEGSSAASGYSRAVIGVGINIRASPSILNLDQPAIDLISLHAQEWSRNTLAACVLMHLIDALQQFDEEGLAPFMPRYRVLDVLEGQEVEIDVAPAKQRGVAVGIAEDGALQVRIGSDIRNFYAGDVSVRRS